MEHKNNFESGQSLFEILLAFSVIALVVVAIVGLSTISLRNSTFSKNKTQASLYAQSTNEWLRSQKDKSWTAFIAKTGAPTDTSLTWCLPTLPTDGVAPDFSWGGSSSTGCNEELESDFIPGTRFTRQIDMVHTYAAATADEIVESTVSIKWTDAQGIHMSRLISVFSNWGGKEGI